MHAWTLLNPEMVKKVDCINVEQMFDEMMDSAQQTTDAFIKTLQTPEWKKSFDDATIEKVKKMGVSTDDLLAMLRLNLKYEIPSTFARHARARLL